MQEQEQRLTDRLWPLIFFVCDINNTNSYKDSAGKVANAKFTYIYRRGSDGKLKILLHNSGFTPAGAVAK